MIEQGASYDLICIAGDLPDMFSGEPRIGQARETSKILPPQFFVMDAVINLTATATGGFVAGDKLVVRIDAKLGCNGQRPHRQLASDTYLGVSR